MSPAVSTVPPACAGPSGSAGGSVSAAPPPNLRAYHQRISQHLMTLMRTPHLPHPAPAPMTVVSSSTSSGTRTTGASSGTSQTSASICSSGRSRQPSKEFAQSPLTASASASASSTSSPDINQLLTARPLGPTGLGLGISTLASNFVSMGTEQVEEEEDEDDEEPTPAGPTHRSILPDQPAPWIPPVKLPATREEEHRAAWDAEGRKVWRAISPNFQLTLAPKSRRGSDDPEVVRGRAELPEPHRRRSEEGTSGSIISTRPATSPSVTALDALGFDIHLHTPRDPQEELARRMGLVVPPKRLQIIEADGAAITRISSHVSSGSGLSAGASFNISSRPTSTSASPHPSSSAFSKSSMPIPRRREERRSSSRSERPKPQPLRNVQDELAYEAKLAHRTAKKQLELARRVRGWYRGVEDAGAEAVISPPDILPFIPSPSLASASMVSSPLAGTVLLPLSSAGWPTAVHVPIKPLFLVPDTPAHERSTSPFDTARVRSKVSPKKIPKVTVSHSVDLELAMRLQALQSKLGDPPMGSKSAVGAEKSEETLKGSARLRQISETKGVGGMDEFGLPLVARP